MLSILVKHCTDPSVAIRKQLSIILTDLLIANPNNEKMVDAWVKGNLPMVKDVEIKVIMIA